MLALLLVNVPATALAAGQQRCPRIELQLPPSVSAATVDRLWGQGEPPQGRAALQLRGCDGQVLDRLPLPASLARLDPRPLQGTAAPTWLVSVDLTADAGSYNGPLTQPVAIAGQRLQWVEAVDAAGRRKPVRLVSTLKADWRRIVQGGRDAFLLIRCEPAGGDFRIVLQRYTLDGAVWRVRERSHPGFWEAEGDFPPLARFP
ncbi:hypothetical protein IGB42_02876 [Andreprevotia sp. IGB-42]|uniref:hypothetical protein n=1 Tax=Andreprevotia sp. IGB-42 TaxID=2497473 RepID=UPI00135BD733|nr:hypothetical protein [Andreprevotia sp. IGB-42]KAF0812587.1 hypothetical protein IGB42_02876 [Andreprevotia sp. IGB-42]